jgi:hypothetical protein
MWKGRRGSKQLDEQCSDELSEAKIAGRMDRGFRRLATMPPKPHKEAEQNRRAAHRRRTKPEPKKG